MSSTAFSFQTPKTDAMTKFVVFLITLLLAWPTLAHGQNIEDTDSVMTVENQLPGVSPYFLQHQYLSVVAFMVAEQDGYIFERPEILNTISATRNGFRSPFHDEDIRVDIVDADGKTVYVWTFPEPHHLREALYMAFFPVDGF